MVKILDMIKNIFSKDYSNEEKSKLVKDGASINDMTSVVIADTLHDIMADVTKPHNKSVTTHSFIEEVEIITDRVITDFTGTDHHGNIIGGLTDCAMKLADNPANLVILAGEIVEEVAVEAISSRCCGFFSLF